MEKGDTEWLVSETLTLLLHVVDIFRLEDKGKHVMKTFLNITVTPPSIINCTRHALIVENIKIAFLRTKTAEIKVMLPCQQNNNKSFYFYNVHILK